MSVRVFFVVEIFPRSLLAEKSQRTRLSHPEGLQNTRGVHSAAARKT